MHWSFAVPKALIRKWDMLNSTRGLRSHLTQQIGNIWRWKEKTKPNTTSSKCSSILQLNPLHTVACFLLDYWMRSSEALVDTNLANASSNCKAMKDINWNQVSDIRELIFKQKKKSTQTCTPNLILPIPVAVLWKFEFVQISAQTTHGKQNKRS